MPMFATYVGFALLSYHFGYWACVVACVIVGLLIGGLTERLLVRGLYGKPEINPIVVMVGFLIVLEAVAAAIWSSFPRSLPTPFSQNLGCNCAPRPWRPRCRDYLVYASVDSLRWVGCFRRSWVSSPRSSSHQTSFRD